jgi:hypothetical protein
MKLPIAGILSGLLLAGMVLPVAAEIVFLDGGQVASADTMYAYQHPSLRSVVFLSPETRQVAISPLTSIYLTPQPLLWRSPTAMPLYPPVPIANELNAGAHPSNRDMVNYNLQRAHGFGQELYYRDAYVNLGGAVTPGYGYGYGYNNLGPAYPPPMTPGFNQPARPSNQSMNIYNLDRAHRYSMDSYKK